MRSFKETEKARLSVWKQTTPYLTEKAREPGLYNALPRAFCLPAANSPENLYSGIRAVALKYFHEGHISWHRGTGGNPSNHLASSQVCCVNFLFPLADQPDALAQLLKPVYPELDQMLPVQSQFVEFEWIGGKNYLGERSSGTRTRGANVTSADAIVRFRRSDGQIQVVLIEWKYTEAYSPTPWRYSSSGTDRTLIYRHLYDREDVMLHKIHLSDFEVLFYEPFYQMMRQQFLAHEMEKARELDADLVSVLHIAPAHNHNFAKVTSAGLRPIASSATAVWKNLVRLPDRFASVSTEALFGNPDLQAEPDLANWRNYLDERYAWLNA